jgi:probable rRNA maturation factor
MAGSRVSIEVHGSDVDVSRLRTTVRRVLRKERAEPAALTIRLTNDEELRRLNREYRGLDEPTDVLSFALGEGDPFPAEVGAVEELGDIAVSLDFAARQARDHGWTLDDEVAHLVVHALLHLCGHDHESGADALRAMRAREEHYLGPLGNVHEI